MGIIEYIMSKTERTAVDEAIINDKPEIKTCGEHSNYLPCQQCAEDEQHGYRVMVMGGRCANGVERDSGTRWHVVPNDSSKAICGAKPGRRSYGWSTYRKLGQEPTCPRCVAKLAKQNLLDREAKLGETLKAIEETR